MTNWARPKKERPAGIPTDLSNLNPNPDSNISVVFEVCKLGREKILFSLKGLQLMVLLGSEAHGILG